MLFVYFLLMTIPQEFKSCYRALSLFPHISAYLVQEAAANAVINIII